MECIGGIRTPNLGFVFDTMELSVFHVAILRVRVLPGFKRFGSIFCTATKYRKGAPVSALVESRLHVLVALGGTPEYSVKLSCINE